MTQLPEEIEYRHFLNGHSLDDCLVRLCLEDVKCSGLTPESLKRAQIKIFRGSSDDLKERLGFTSIDGQPILELSRLIEFPYLCRDGKVVLIRFKLIPITMSGSKECRYQHPLHAAPIPYILPEVWPTLDAPHEPVWIVDGEKKALALVQHGRTVIGLSGVWNFKSKNSPGDEVLFRELKDISWLGRTVYLGFDADLWTNVSVRIALYEISLKLYAAGANVRIATWKVETGKGIDDFLLTRQDDPSSALRELECRASELTASFDRDHRHEILHGIKLVFGSLNRIDREILIKGFADRIRVSVKSVAEELKSSEKDEGGLFENIEPWPNPVTTVELLNEITATIRRFVVLPERSSDAVALWCLHTWATEAAITCPILAVESPEKRCGKTKLLSVLIGIVRRPLAAANITPAATFRSIEKWSPTLIIDEGDAFLKDNEELRGILNSGHTRSTAFVVRCQGEEFEPVRFSTWGPKVIALIGSLPGTLEDRSIVVRMSRRRPDEKIERLRTGQMAFLVDIARKAARWAADSLPVLMVADPKIPDGLHDRAADNWSPLLAIAELAGGDWSQRAQDTARFLSGVETEDQTAAVMLLEDIREYFEVHGERIPSSDLVAHLVGMEGRPWPEWCKGLPITPRQVARLLRPLGIFPTTIRDSEDPLKGYKKESFVDAFSRYLAPPDVLSVTTLQVNNRKGFSDIPSVTLENDVTDNKARIPNEIKGCNVVTDKNPLGGEVGENGDLFPDFSEPEVFEIGGIGL